MLRVGANVRDQHGECARIADVFAVPETRDLFGGVVPAHHRLVLVYADGRWRNDVMEGEIAYSDGGDCGRDEADATDRPRGDDAVDS